MDAKRISPTYWEQQKERVDSRFQKLLLRDNALIKGLGIPSEDDLAIGTGKHMNMAVLFLDICKSTARSDNTPGGQHRELQGMTIFFDAMIKIIEDLDGTVEKNTGDGLMAYFEDAGYSDNGCTRAISAAMHMKRTNELLISPRLVELGIDPFVFRVGIDYGTVTVARVGRARGFNGIVAIGITANIAAKILNAAEAGEIVIGEWVAGQLPDEWKGGIAMHTEATGFTQGSTLLGQRPYPFYKFDWTWQLAA
jgi:adenylate cyclase